MCFACWAKPMRSYSPYFLGSDTIRFRLLPERIQIILAGIVDSYSLQTRIGMLFEP